MECGEGMKLTTQIINITKARTYEKAQQSQFAILPEISVSAFYKEYETYYSIHFALWAWCFSIFIERSE